MQTAFSRRRFLQGAAAGSVIVGFNPGSRTWVSEAQASSFPFHRVPTLKGSLLSDSASLAAAGRDNGFIASGTPVAVLDAGSANDIAKMLKFCARYGIKAVGRGQGHAMFGQSLCAGGLSIRTSNLNAVHEISTGSVWADAGITWNALLRQTLATGQTPIVLTGFLGLSLGGTLAMAGIGGMSYKFGAQVDHVLEIEVVTGAGSIMRCSRQKDRFLFDAVLSGVGNVGIITKARIALAPARAQVRNHTLIYFDAAQFFAQMRTLVAREEFDMVWGSIAPDPTHGWQYQLSTATFFDDVTPDDSYLLRDLKPDADSFADSGYEAFQTRIDGLLAFLRASNMWEGVPHPWLDLFLPDRTMESFVGSIVPTLTLTDVGFSGLIQIFPIKRRNLKQPLTRVPNDDLVFLFDILSSVDTPATTPDTVTQLLARNRRLFEQARAAGGTLYPISAVEMSKTDWQRQFGLTYLLIGFAKAVYDPSGVLKPGVSIF